MLDIDRCDREPGEPETPNVGPKNDSVCTSKEFLFKLNEWKQQLKIIEQLAMEQHN